MIPVSVTRQGRCSMSTDSVRLGWGHVNINVRDLDRSVEFYRLLGFELFLPGIPYLGLSMEWSVLPDGCAEALGLAVGVRGRACIMQIDEGYPKLDLTEFDAGGGSKPLGNADRGLVRVCLVSRDLAADHGRLLEAGVRFLTPPRAGVDGLGDIATCMDPDGTLIELLQVYPERWAALLGG